jgi:NAD(P)-dependent dehydrogenase (short-subunit alcohol dehydrogenase family)
MTARFALVTGGTRGIGLGIARALAAEGWTLALGGVRAPAEVQHVLDELPSAEYFQADIGATAERRRLVDAVCTRFGRIDALVNNAGRAPRQRADVLETTEASFAEVLDVNLRGPFFLTQEVARRMIARPADRTPSAIVFVTSVSAQMVSLTRGEYCVSKAGLSMAASLFAVRLAPHGIPVYEVRPGIIATDMTAGVRDLYDERIAAGLVPERRWGTPADVGRVVAALLRGDAPYATGSVINIDGGLALPRL